MSSFFHPLSTGARAAHFGMPSKSGSNSGARGVTRFVAAWKTREQLTGATDQLSATNKPGISVDI